MCISVVWVCDHRARSSPYAASTRTLVVMDVDGWKGQFHVKNTHTEISDKQAALYHTIILILNYSTAAVVVPLRAPIAVMPTFNSLLTWCTVVRLYGIDRPQGIVVVAITGPHNG